MVALPGDLSEPHLPTDEDEESTLSGSEIIKENPQYKGGYISVKIRNLCNLNQVFTLVCPSTITYEEFFHDVSNRTSMKCTEFEVVYQDGQGKIHELGEQPKALTLASVNILPDTQKVYSMQIEKKRVKRKLVARRLDAELEAVQDQAVEPMQVEVSSEGERADSPIPSTSSNDFTGREFVGLKNQSTTCYLNSLIQSLFFCPEFRNVIYNSVFEYDPTTKSLGLALQRLFLQLQFSVRGSVETSEITSTFGWKGDENTVQHDVEECYRILLDLLSDEYRKSNLNSVSESLFGGIMNDYVQCLLCHKKNSKRELFLAIPLPVRMFGKPLSQPTLEEALRTFVQAELLNDGNQYKCDNCQCLVDAHKGLCFQKLPYIMCIQLKRSEFDFELMTRRKVIDKLIFPMILNMNEFVDDKSEDEKTNNLVPPIHVNDITGPSLKTRTSHSRPVVSLSKGTNWAFDDPPTNETDNVTMNGALGSMSQNHIEMTEEALKSGNNVYQLLSVLIHRGGSSLAGHYYVYVLDLERNQWYRCNDSSVSRISESDIKDTYGGGSPFGRCDDRDAIAYMLVYRRIDFSMNSLPMVEEQFPAHIKEIWKKLEIADKNRYAQDQYERSILKFPLYYRIHETWETLKSDVIISKTSTIKEAALQCYLAFFPDHKIIEDSYRLVRFHNSLQIMDMSFDGQENETIGIAYRRPTNIEQKDALMIEIADDYSPFESYSTKDFVFKTHYVDLKSHILTSSREIHRCPGSIVGDLRSRISYKFMLPRDKIEMIVNGKVGIHVLDDDNLCLSSSSFSRLNELFVTCMDSEDIGNFSLFVNNYYSSYQFEIHCQMMNPFDSSSYEEMDSTIIETYGEVSEDLNSFTPMDNYVDHESSIQFHLSDAVEIMQDDNTLSEESIQLEKDLTDHSTSEDSSLTTSSEMTLMGSESSASSCNSPNRNDDKMSDSGLQMVSAKSEDQCMASDPESFYFRVLDKKLSLDGEWLVHKVRAQVEMTLEAISGKISKLMSADESQFIICTITHGCESEILHITGNLRGLCPFDTLRARIGHRLTKDEGRIGLYLLELENFVKRPTFLKDVVLHSDMTIEMVRNHIQQELSALIDFDIEILKYFRLRKKVNNNPSRIMYNKMRITDFFPNMNGHMFLQPLKEPDECKEQGHTLMVRRWHPAELTLDDPKEFVIFYDYVVSLEELLKDTLVKLFSIAPENLEVASPEADYPYDLNPIEIHEKLIWNQLDATKRRLISIHNDEGALIIRDKREVLKDISSEDRRMYEKESADRRGEYILTPRKSEVGFKVNLARSPESS